MDYNQAKEALCEICKRGGSGDEKEVKKILDYHNNTNLINEDLNGYGSTILMCAYAIADKSNKAFFLELLENHSKAKTALTSSTITPSKHSNEGSLSSNNVIPQTALKESSIVEEMKDRELLTVVEEKESFKLQIEGLEEKMREITNNNMKEMERRLQEREDSLKLVVERRLEEKEKECVLLRDQIVRMEERFESWMKQMEKRFDEKERQDSLGRVVTSLPLPLRLPPNKQTHVFLTHTWREDEKGRNNHDRVGRVNEALRKRGLVTWFDSERLEDKIHETISKALYSTCCVLIFVTREYEKKVNSADDSDYCFYEFNVAATDRRLANMRIPIVMDESMLNPDSWEEGLLKAGLGGKVFIDVSSDDKDVFEERCNEVFVRVVKLLNI